MRYWTHKENDAIARLPGASICNAITALTNPYMARKDGSGVVSRINEGATDRLAMLKIRWTEHPRTWTADAGEAELDLPPERALSETTHVRFFDDNIVAIDYNRTGPHPYALRDYVRDRLPDQFGGFSVVQIPDRTAKERLNRIASVKAVGLQLSTESLAKIPTTDHDYMKSIKDNAEFGGAGVVNIEWKRFSPSDRLNAEALKAMVQYLIEHATDLDDRAQIVVNGTDPTGNPEYFSLKRDYVSTHARITRRGGRTLQSEDVFQALGVAFNEVRHRFPDQTFIVGAPPPP